MQKLSYFKHRKLKEIQYIKRFLQYQYYENFTFNLTHKTKRIENIENVISVASIQSKSRSLLNELKSSKSENVALLWLDSLVNYMKIHPIARRQVFKEKGVSHILKLRECATSEMLLGKIRVALALLGYVDPVQGRGVRILALDGGGTRGVMTIEMLKRISEKCEQPIYNLFDLIVGTSTGGILAFLIGIKKASLQECDALYEKLSKDIFHVSKIFGSSKLFLQHSYYSTNALTNILKNELGKDNVLIDTAAQKGPKVIAVSTIVNQPVLQAYAFRTYSLPENKKKNVVLGSSKHLLWEALRASTAAPGYFDEYLLGDGVFQDGGILTNNPCALAIHEAKTLWPYTPIQTIVSIGTGTYRGRAVPHTAHFTTLREKLSKLVASATDVEAIHHIIEDLIPPSQYIRLNPNMSVDAPLDETRPEVLLQLRKDTRNYINKFSHKFDAAAISLMKHKRFVEKCKDKIELELLKKGWV